MARVLGHVLGIGYARRADRAIERGLAGQADGRVICASNSSKRPLATPVHHSRCGWHSWR
jgi:hypothetical protein